METLILSILAFLLLADRIYAEYRHRKECMHYLDFIDRLQNKLMARSLGEYEASNRPGGKVVNPLMKRIEDNYKARGGDHDAV